MDRWVKNRISHRARCVQKNLSLAALTEDCKTVAFAIYLHWHLLSGQCPIAIFNKPQLRAEIVNRAAIACLLAKLTARAEQRKARC